MKWFYLAFLLICLLADFLIAKSEMGKIAQDVLTTENQKISLIETIESGNNPTHILGTDKNGIPVICGCGEESLSNTSSIELTKISTSSILPDQTRSWETIPSVIRTDGIETFRLEVNVNGPVNKVTIDKTTFHIIFPQNPPFLMRDDGLGEDRIAGDNIYTAGPFRYNTAEALPQYYNYDSSSPEGLFADDFADVIIEELDGTESEFLIEPAVGFLRSDIPDTQTTSLSENIIASKHLINISTSLFQTQRFIRGLDYNINNITKHIYEVLPDRYDFFIFFSINRIERLPFTYGSNFYAGIHKDIKVNYSGTGTSTFDRTETYGSNGKLLSVNILDTLDRGISARTATHEITHQWASSISYTLGLSDLTGHYKNTSSAASLVGGFKWIDNGDGTFTIDKSQGTNGGYSMPPLDKYMMGLLEANEVPVHYVHDGSISNNTVYQEDIAKTVTIEDIINRHGPRIPRPDEAQKAFNIAFVAESHERFLNSTEMTFYEILADYYTKQIPVDEPTPYVGENWVPLTRYFGETTRWSSRIFPWADINLDLIVDLEDLSLLCEKWLGQHYTSDNYPEGGDGIVNLSDWASFAADWQNGSTDKLSNFIDEWLKIGYTSKYIMPFDIAPELGGDNSIDLLDFTLFAEYWLHQ